MPIPREELARWRQARVHLPDGRVLPEAPLPPELGPVAWVLPADGGLLRSLRQRGQSFLEVELELEDRQPALLIPGMTRRKAVQLGYKRKLWAVLGFGQLGMQVVYTGINSRMR